MFKVLSSQFNYLYGNQIHFPYSIARLVAYVKTNTQLSPNFEFLPTFIYRDELEKNILECKDADILLCSCYVWNWEITLRLAKKVKELNPTCLIIFGGPQVPNKSKNFFKQYNFVDILVHGEGEMILEKILYSYMNDKDFSKIDGIETKDFRTKPNSRITDLSTLPSPYLTNVIWDLVEKRENMVFAASWETNRGCPYPCTFCDWGGGIHTKLRQRPVDILKEEIDIFEQKMLDISHGICYDDVVSVKEKYKLDKVTESILIVRIYL